MQQYENGTLRLRLAELFPDEHRYFEAISFLWKARSLLPYSIAEPSLILYVDILEQSRQK